ncbi:ATP-binding cassette domain-containing protein [Actinomadura sp. CNU-125]|uniref:ATP-binding cassette domain-containing protein n=1 Tax=Actinomadura sp. CNU-125 TaxID=1904961 RepID=UPI0021CCF800|nr:ATP-binding cassette domain-containing protein [Actinomadura sp. CNU-125]
MWREIAPNVVAPALSYAFTLMAVVVIAEGALAFLGLSVQPPTPTWGGMINEGRSTLDTAAHIVVVPSAAMFLTVLALNLVGDRLQELTGHRPGGLEPARPRRRTAAPSVPVPRRDGPLLEVTGLRTGFRTPRGTLRAVDGVSFTLERGRTLAIVGESGSGKSILIRSVLGLLPDDAERTGRARLADRDLTGDTRDVLGTRMAAVFQDPMTALNPVRTVAPRSPSRSASTSR